MNINEQMRELATMGGLAYAPSEELISSLLGKTKRVRAARQATTTAATTLGIAAVGLVAAQVYAATKDDPAFQDRNVINNKNNLTPIEQYRAKFGKENPTRSNQPTVDLSGIINSLKASNSQPNGLNPGGGSKPTAPATAPAKPEPTKPAATTAPPAPACTAPGGGQDGMYYDCTSKQWLVKDGYFMFGNGHVYPMVQWTDAATGLTDWGNWSGTGWGWETKAIHMGEPGDKSFSYDDDSYTYMGSNASWSGNTCNGVTTFAWNATVRASCMPDWRVDATGKPYHQDGGIVWIATNPNMRWNDCRCEFDDITNPPAGWYWDGGSWHETPTPTA